MTDRPRRSWEIAMDYGIETGRYILVGEKGTDWRDAPMELGPNFDTAPLHPDPLVAAEQQIIDNMLRMQQQRQAQTDDEGDQ